MKTKDLQYEEELKKIYIDNYINLIVDNIALRYKIYGNFNSLPLQFIINSSKDSFELNDDEDLKVNNLVAERLKDKYKLELVSKNPNDIMKIKEIN